MNLFHLSRFCLNILSHCIQFCYSSIVNVIANNSLIWQIICYKKGSTSCPRIIASCHFLLTSCYFLLTSSSSSLSPHFLLTSSSLAFLVFEGLKRTNQTPSGKPQKNIRKPKENKKTKLWGETIFSISKDGFLFFWLHVATSVQKPSVPFIFLFLKAWNQKIKHPLEGNQKKTKKPKENQKNKTLRWNHLFPFNRLFFFWGVQCYFLKSGNFVCFVTKSRNSASRYSTFVKTWFLIWIKYIISLKKCASTCILQWFCTYLTFGYSDWK